MTTPDAQEVKNVVKERYAARAKGATSCCGPEELEAETGAYPGIYLGTDTSSLGPEVLAASAGCGNPTATPMMPPITSMVASKRVSCLDAAAMAVP